MRRFIVVSTGFEEGRESAPVLCRCVSASLMLSHALRGDAELHVLFFREGACISFYSNRLRNIRPDEASLRGVFRKAFHKIQVGAFEDAGQVHSGVLVRKTLLEDLIRGGERVFYSFDRGLSSNFETLFSACKSPIFVVPLQEYPVEALRALEEMGATPLKLPSDYWPDHLIAVVNILLDRVGVP